jgi:hypothetical protein
VVFCAFVQAAAPSGRPVLQWGGWHTIGPFDNDGNGFSKTYPPEHGVDFKASYKGKDGKTVSWKARPGFKDGKVIDLLPHFTPNLNITVYLVRQVTASRACEVELEMGSDDTITLWVNGKQYLANNAARPCRLGDENVRVSLKKGANTLLLKICQGKLWFGFAFKSLGVDLPVGKGEIPSQFRMLEMIRSGRRKSSRFATPKLTHRPESLISPTDRGPADIVLRRTAALLKDIRKMKGPPDLSVEAKLLAKLQAENKRLGDTADRQVQYELHRKCCELRRRIAFANPLLNFDKILFIKHKKNRNGELAGDHMAGQYYGIHATKGEGLFILDNAFGPKPVARDLLKDAKCRNGRFADAKLPDGAYLSPDLSFDGKKVLFAYTEAEGYRPEQKAREDAKDMYSYSGLKCSFTKKNCWHIFSVNADGKNLRSVTDGPWNDFDPCWMPNGKVAFISDRRGGFGRCHCSANGGAPWYTYTLHAVNADGKDMVRLSHHETCEWQPSITNEGLIVYTRWDYVDRGFFQAHHPWTTTPDGRNALALHGNYPKNWRDRPCMEMNIRSIPGSQRLVSVAAAHHGQTYGSIVLVDPRVEDDDAMAPVRLVTPEERFPESEYGYFCREAAYGTPWPLSEDYYLCVYGYSERRRKDKSVENYGIYLLDSFGNKELLYRDPKIACLSPIPLRARPTPPIVPNQVKPYPVDPKQQRLNLDRPALMADAVARQLKHEKSVDRTEGIVSIANVYETRRTWPENTRITALRIVQILPKSAPGRDNPKIGYSTEKNARSVLGTVPVEKDGSIHFKLPPYIPVYFQALNEQGMAVQSMRSIIYVAPKEKLSCLGCHEKRLAAPPTVKKPLLAMQRKPSIIKPEPDGSNPFSFVRLVQPVLSAKCADCHAKKILEKKKAPALTGKNPDKRGWPESYRNLQKYSFYYNDGAFVESKTYPGKFGALASPLYKHLKKGHQKVKLTPNELRRITLWLDCNSDFYGTYEKLPDQASGKIVKPILE